MSPPSRIGTRREPRSKAYNKKGKEPSYAIVFPRGASSDAAKTKESSSNGKPPSTEQDQQGREPEVPHRATAEEVGSLSPDYSEIHFGDAEQRAYERLQNVMRMIDDWLRI